MGPGSGFGVRSVCCFLLRFVGIFSSPSCFVHYRQLPRPKSWLVNLNPPLMLPPYRLEAAARSPPALAISEGVLAGWCEFDLTGGHEDPNVRIAVQVQLHAGGSTAPWQMNL